MNEVNTVERPVMPFGDRAEMYQQALKRVRAIEFGEPVTNICASERNPQRLAYFVSLDAKRLAKCTDRKGKFWQTGIEVVYPGHLDYAECNRLFDPVHAVLFERHNAEVKGDTT